MVLKHFNLMYTNTWDVSAYLAIFSHFLNYKNKKNFNSTMLN